LLKLLHLPCQTVLKQKFEIDKANKLIHVDYTVDNCNPKIFDIIEYKFNITSNIKALKVKSITIIFNNQERNKIFSQNEPYIFTKDTGLNLSFKIFIKDTDKNLQVKLLRFELYTENGNEIYLEYFKKFNKDKVLTLKSFDSEILEFNYERNHRIGLSQYYNIECGVVKKATDIHIDLVTMKFTLLDELDQSRSSMMSYSRRYINI
jgi:hypothetical protein